MENKQDNNTPHKTTLHYTTLHYTTLHYTTLHYTTLHYTTLHYTTLHYTTLHYTTLHYTTLHYTTLHCTAINHTTLHCTIPYYITSYHTHHITSFTSASPSSPPVSSPLLISTHLHSPILVISKSPSHHITPHYTALHYLFLAPSSCRSNTHEAVRVIYPHTPGPITRNYPVSWGNLCVLKFQPLRPYILYTLYIQ